MSQDTTDLLPEPTSARLRARGRTPADAEPARALVEFLVVLILAVITFRTFAAEAYIVPTGSMAPTLLGMHRVVPCTNCKMSFPVGLSEDGRSGRAVCPNCGQDGLDRQPSLECSGDRLLVQKYLYDLRRPRRWEVAVFQSPVEPSQAYVKRVVGLPGERVQVVGGDLFIDGRIARKSLEQQHAMRVPVHDSSYTPADSARYPRWVFRKTRSGPTSMQSSGWISTDNRFVHSARGESADDAVDWLDYRHWQADRVRYGPVNDFSPYNGADLRGEHLVPDVAFEAEVTLSKTVKAVAIRAGRGGDGFLITLPVGAGAEPEVSRNGEPVTLSNAKRGPVARLADAERATIEVSLMDRRLIVAIDGEPVFDPYDFDEPVAAPGLGPFASPVGFGLVGTGAEVHSLRLFRDVYYTPAMASAPRKAFAVDRPYQLKEGEYFVLGDNSAVSNDSRFWDHSPVVREEMFLGKPFLVHLPGQVMPLKVFGQSVYWVPDPREIRYIR